MYDDQEEPSAESISGTLSRHSSQNSLDESSRKPYDSSSKLKDILPYKNCEHAQNALESLKSMRRENVMCDIKLVAEGKEVFAHRTVLASSSPYFYAMLTKFEERKLECVILQSIDGSVLEQLIDYIYTSEIVINEANVQSLLSAANLLQLLDVRDACCDFLSRQLDPSNCLGIYTYADMHNCSQLVETADIFIEQHFTDVSKQDEFLTLPIAQLISLLQKDKLMVNIEEEVFEAVINWIKHDPDNRRTHLPNLMEYVRLPLVSREFLIKVSDEPLLKNDSNCKDYLIEAMKYHLLTGEEKKNMKSPRVIQRKSNIPQLLLVVGGQAPKAIQNVDCYDFVRQKWTALSSMSTRRCRAGIVTLDGKAYAVGGFNGSLRVKTVDVYDINANMWVPGVSMEARRSTLGVAVLDNKIYAVGGFDGTMGLHTAEVFDPRMQYWRPIANMSTRRSSVGVGVLDDRLYAVGGYDGSSRQCLSTVEYYNPETNNWYDAPEMTFRRSGAGVGVLNGILYAIGGHDGPTVRKSVEAYDPELGQWVERSPMNFHRRNAGVVVFDDCLYVVGGDDGISNLSSVEVYSPKNNHWIILSHPMSIARSYAGVTLVEKPPDF